MEIEAKPEWSFSWGIYGGTNVGYMTITLHVYIKTPEATYYYGPNVHFRNTKAEFEETWNYLIRNSAFKYLMVHYEGRTLKEFTEGAGSSTDFSDFYWEGKPVFKDIYDKFSKMMVEREEYIRLPLTPKGWDRGWM